jgi:hypothetical protein
MGRTGGSNTRVMDIVGRNWILHFARHYRGNPSRAAGNGPDMRSRSGYIIRYLARRVAGIRCVPSVGTRIALDCLYRGLCQLHADWINAVHRLVHRPIAHGGRRRCRLVIWDLLPRSTSIFPLFAKCGADIMGGRKFWASFVS